MINNILKPLDATYFPIAGMMNIIFQLRNGQIKCGKYTFNNNELMQRRWIDTEGNEYTSDMILKWYNLEEKE